MTKQKASPKPSQLPFRVYSSDQGNQEQIYTAVHRHLEIEICCVFQGTLYYNIYGRRVTVKEGETIYISPNAPHSMRAEEDCRFGTIQFLHSKFASISSAQQVKHLMLYHYSISPPYKTFLSPELFAAVSDAVLEASNRLTSFSAFVKSNIYKLLGILYRDGCLCDPERFSKDPRFLKLLPLISHINSCSKEPRPLSSSSKQMDLSAAYLCRIFRKTTGTTITKYTNFIRICNAERLLMHTPLEVSDIASAVGFFSTSYFNKIFKRHKHLSPQIFRRLILLGDGEHGF